MTTRRVSDNNVVFSSFAYFRPKLTINNSIWDIAASDAKKAEIAAKKEADGMCAVSGFYDAFSVWYRLCHVLYSYLYYILSITAKAAAEKREQAAKAAAEKKEADG